MAAESVLPGIGNAAISWLKTCYPPLVVFSVPLIPQPSLLCPVISPLLEVEPLSRCLAALPEAAQHHCNMQLGWNSPSSPIFYLNYTNC